MTSLIVFLSGAALLIYSAEKLIDNLIGIARSLTISMFFIAVVFTGIEFDDIALGVALNLEDLDDVALGTVIGATLSIIGVALAIAAIVAPTEIHIPRDYIALFGAAPIMVIGFVLIGPLGIGTGAVLLGGFAAFVVYIAARERIGDKPVFRDAEMYEEHPTARGTGRPSLPTRVYATRPGTGGGHAVAVGLDDPPVENALLLGDERRPVWTRFGLAVLAILGLVVGSAATTIGTDGILKEYGLEGTVFGATIATAVLTLEDVFLTVAPARRGAPEVAIGNIIGSVVFSLTGKLGIVLLAGGLVVEPHVFNWHFPTLGAAVGLTAYFLSTGRLQRWHGVALLAFYAIYWFTSLFIVGQPLVED